jgi:hypothetical protein
VEAGFEGEDGELRRAGGFVSHAGRDVFFAEFDVCSSSLVLAAPHEGCFVCCFVGVGARHASEDLVEAFGGDFEDAGSQNGGPVVGGEVSEGGAVDECGGHLFAEGGGVEGGVIVAYGNRGNLCISVSR